MTDLTKGVTELVLEARDLEASERFYTEVLGLPVVLRWEGPAWKGREAVWVQSGDRTRIGLWKPFVGIAGARPGAHVHFAMTVSEEDYTAAVARAHAQGVPVDEVYFGDDPAEPGQRSAYVTDPDGHVVELWTRDVATQVDAGPPHAVTPDVFGV
ncbi:VOC family protein [Amycolatopsis sp. RTGN1]|uniref:VOC family protein n=1 Tax=Amycolatopsis ponsaeliensis TaxID=2992142 RepID=UPI00254A8F17|nr:VOC family protein [Amycolatopsis sp. RTGN1]